MGLQYKTILLETGIWLALFTLLFSAFAQDMQIKYAGFRAGGLSLLTMAIHYSNVALFNRTVKRGKLRRYFIYLPFLWLAMTSLRIPLELYIFPSQAIPRLLQGEAFRPGFYLIATALVLSVSTIVLYLVYLFGKENHLLQTINKHKEARLQLLQSQINPHFLFNTLNNIYSLSISHSPQTPEVILQLTELLRHSVYQNPTEKVSVSEEAKQIEFLIRLFSLRRDEPYPILFQKNISGGMIEPMILVPLVENCLKHCDLDINNQAFIKIDLFADNTHIRFITENSFSAHHHTCAIGGVGLKNIQERLELIYGHDFVFKIAAVNTVFTVTLEMKWRR